MLGFTLLEWVGILTLARMALWLFCEGGFVAGRLAARIDAARTSRRVA